MDGAPVDRWLGKKNRQQQKPIAGFFAALDELRWFFAALDELRGFFAALGMRSG